MRPLYLTYFTMAQSGTKGSITICVCEHSIGIKSAHFTPILGLGTDLVRTWYGEGTELI